MSVVVTTNLSFSEWPSVLGDGKMRRPHDRLAHCREIVEMGNESWRFLQCSKGRSGLEATPPRNSENRPLHLSGQAGNGSDQAIQPF